jgi:AcrR family transcriptional regulator
MGTSGAPLPEAARETNTQEQKRAAKSSDANAAQKPRRSQQERLIDAMIGLCAQRGYAGVSIEQLCARAGVSPATLYERFGSKEECLVAAYRAVAERILGDMADVSANGDWPRAARLALRGLLESLQRDANAGRLLLIEGVAGGPAMRAERGRVISGFERRALEVLDMPSRGQTLDVPVMAVVGAVRHIASRRLRAHAADQLPSLQKDILAWIECYATPGGRSRWSTSTNALLEVPPSEEPPVPSTQVWTPERLPPGRHGLSADVVARSQRTRLIFGTAEMMLAKGYADATVADIVAAAGVAKDVFYQHFADKQHAFLEAQDYPTQYVLDRCAEAYFGAERWPERLWRCLGVLIELIAANPAISHLRLVECYAAGPAAIRRAEDVTRSFTIFLEEGYGYRPAAAALPRLCSQAIAGAIFEIVQQHIAHRDPSALRACLPQLTYLALAPFSGTEEAIELVEELKARTNGDRRRRPSRRRDGRAPSLA